MSIITAFSKMFTHSNRFCVGIETLKIQSLHQESAKKEAKRRIKFSVEENHQENLAGAMKMHI